MKRSGRKVYKSVLQKRAVQDQVKAMENRIKRLKQEQ
jgi:hypothetical protein